MRWTGHVALGGEGRSIYDCCGGSLREEEHLEDPGVDGRIILR